MKRAELLVAVVLMLLLAYQPNVFVDASSGPAAFTIFGVTLLILANWLRHTIHKT
jgi:protein-S-isoprenylcysteine O-methyltransferase Ste14